VEGDTDTSTGTEAVAVAASASTTGHMPLESVAELSRVRVGYTTADLGAEIMREMEDIERIASTAKNLKGTSVRRLKLPSRRARSSGAELQQRTVATFAVASTMADLCRLRIRDSAVDGDVARSDDARTEASGRVIVEEAKSICSQEQEDGAYLRRRVRYLESEVSRLQGTVERLTKECSERAVTRGTSVGSRHAVGNSTTRGTKANSPGAPTGTIMGPPPPPPLHSQPSSSHFRCSGGAGSNEGVAGEGTKKTGGSGPRDLLEDLKALLLRKAEKWWQEMALSDVIPPVTDAAAVSRTVRKKRGPEAQTPPTVAVVVAVVDLVRGGFGTRDGGR
jgi:hypothetical protein